MRLSLWLGLLVAFSVGMCCAFALRSLHFEAKPVVVRAAEPTTKILVAMKTIPSGIEITADFVAFQEVAVSEIPMGALANFNHVYRRQPAYPIPAGCPICEDLLLPHDESVPQAAFIPTGSQLVTLDVAHVRHGHMTFSPQEPISSVLAADQRVDIRIVPQGKTPGRLAEIKNQVLQAFAPYDFQNSGELILENVPIHQIQRKSSDVAGLPKDSLVLMLDQTEAAQLATAARKGQLRVLLHQNGEPVPLPGDVENYFEIAQQSPALFSDIPPLALEQPTNLAESVPAAPLPPDIFGTELLFEPLPVPALVKSPVVPELVGESVSEERVSIRNDVPMDFSGTSAQRLVPAEQPVVQNPNLIEPVFPPSPSNLEPKKESVPLPYLEPVLGSPRVTQSLQLVAPNGVAPAGTYPQELVKQTENTVMLPVSSAVPQIVVSQTVPSSTIPQERTAVQGYSPFERRTSMVSSASLELTAPSLLKTADTVVQTQ